MSDSLPSSTPPGWYPDPSGSPQWRVWTGSRWSELTRPYGARPEISQLLTNFKEVRALRGAARYGIGCVTGAIGLAVGVATHWTHSAQPASQSFLAAAVAVSLALLIVGSAALSFAVNELNGEVTPLAYIPLVNLVTFTALVTHKMGGRPVQRVLSQLVLLALFIASYSTMSWMVVALLIVTIDEISWTNRLIERLSGDSVGFLLVKPKTKA